MSRTFLIADTHFRHGKIIEYEKAHRPFATIMQHDEELIRRWNMIVRPRDVVWHLGDVLFGGPSVLSEYMERLNGVKHLVLGNHDKLPRSCYSSCFETVCDIHEIEPGVVLSHKPILSLKPKARVVIHGHDHSRTPRVSRQGDRLYLNVSAENTLLAPIDYALLRTIWAD